jgi:carbon monoxide dehydrogenase subunit G
MVTAESSIDIARPAAEVFEFVSDLRNDPKWHTDILDAQLTSQGPVAAGSVFAIKFKPFMGQSQGTVTVAEHSPPRRTVLKGQMGKFAPTVTLMVEPEGEGARFTRRVEMQPPGLMRLMSPFMGGMFRKQNAGFVANLKRVLES